MFRSSVKTAFRSLLRNRQATALNLLGLAIGLGACLLMAGYVFHELSFERMHVDRDRIFRVNSLITMGGGTINNATVAFPLGPAVEASLPEVDASVRIVRRSDVALRVGDRNFKEPKVFFAESRFFNVFSLPLLRGDPESALDAPFSVVLDETLARKLFGGGDPIGEVVEIRIDGFQPFRVTGVMGDIPSNTVLRRPLVMSLSTVFRRMPEQEAVWRSWGTATTFLRLKNGADPEEVGGKVQSLALSRLGEEGKGVAFYLQPFPRIYFEGRSRGMSNDLDNTGSPARVVLFSLIALLILIVASVNFINLSTARVTRRMKEVGVRKTCGAARSTLVRQFLTEAFLLTAAAMALGLVLFTFLKPVLDRYLGKDLSLGLFKTPMIFPCAAIFVILVGFLAGSYPALYLSRFPAAVVFRQGPSSSFQRSGLRRGLVVFQFVVAVALASITLVVIKQVHFAEKKDLGFDIRGLVLLENGERALSPKTAVLRAEILIRTEARAATVLDSFPSSQNRNIRTVRAEGRSSEEETMVQSIEVDPAFVPAMGLELVDGRNFGEDRAGDEASVLVNAKAALALGYENPVGRTLTCGEQVFRIIGVLRDWHTNSIHSQIYPTVLFPADESASTLVVRLNPGDEGRTIEGIREVWNGVLPGQTFEYAFVDDILDDAYGKERRLAGFLVFFCFLTVFVACLGVFGLASFTTEQRTKEIGIRKILGAGTAGIVGLLVRGFATWILAGWGIAIPIAVYSANRWLQGFTYRTPLGAGPFLAAGLLALTIALLSVIFQTVRAASANPVEALRYE